MNLTDLLNQFLQANQFASGGLLLMGLSGILGGLYKVLPILWRLIKRKFIVTIDIQSNNDVFRWLSIWLARHEYSKKTRLLTVHTDQSASDNTMRDKDAKPSLYFSPAPGNHLIWYRGRPVWIHRDRERKMGNDGKGLLSIYEQFYITMLGRDRELAKDLLRDVRDFIHDMEKDDTCVYACSGYGNWRRIKRQKPRSLASVVLKGDMQQVVYREIKEFYAQRRWYGDRGVPFRRGYLLHGPPGTGKTSLVKAIAGVMNMNIYIISISNGISDDEFSRAITDVPEYSIILLEDVDAAFDQRQKADEDQKVTFKTLLNTIDGVISPEGTILFMTTNHIDKLDPALRRSGRVDRELYLGYADPDQAARMFAHFYPQTNGECYDFANRLEGRQITPADIQKHFLDYKHTPEQAVEHVDKL